MKEKYIFIGDSLTFGYGVKKIDTWVTKIRNNCSCEVINKGINGSTTTDMLDRFSTDVVRHNPTKVFIMGGTNDLLSNRGIKTIIENIELMIKDCISINSEVIVGIPPTIIAKDAQELFMPSLAYSFCSDNLPILRKELISLCTLYNCKYVDFYKLALDNPPNLIFFDGIHLNAKGQEMLFEKAKDFFYP